MPGTFIVALGAAAAAVATAAPAQSPRAPYEPIAIASRQVLTVSLDAATPVRLPSSATGVVIGNPTIAGVSVQNDRLLFVTGKSYGSTNLIVVGASGEAIYQGRITVIPDETNAVMLTRGASVVRYDCAPLCRRRPDLSDEPDAFNAITSLIAGRSGGGGGP